MLRHRSTNHGEKDLRLSLKWLSITALLAALVGCASPVPKVDVTPQQLATVSTITIYRLPEFKEYTVLNIGHAAGGFGLIGGLIAAADQQSKQSRLSAALNERGFTLASHLPEQVAQQLNKRGYKTEIKDGPWEKIDDKGYKVNVEKIQDSTDAVLVLVPTIVGFVSPQFSTQYLPTITVSATLLGPDRKTPLYRGYHAAGWQPKAEGWRNADPPAKTFGNFEELMADLSITATALQGACQGVAKTIAEDLTR
jgi:hypothetical protein